MTVLDLKNLQKYTENRKKCDRKCYRRHKLEFLRFLKDGHLRSKTIFLRI